MLLIKIKHITVDTLRKVNLFRMLALLSYVLFLIFECSLLANNRIYTFHVSELNNIININNYTLWQILLICSPNAV